MAQSDSLDRFEQVERSKTFLILYPFLENSTTGIAIITGQTGAKRVSDLRERKKSGAEKECHAAIPSGSQSLIAEFEALATPSGSQSLTAELEAERVNLAIQGSEKAKLSKNLAELSVEKEKHDATKLELETANLPFWKKFGM